LKLLKLIFMLAVAVFPLSPHRCLASNNNYNLNLKVFPTTFDYLKKTVLSPVHFTGADWKKAGMIAAGTGLLYSQDTAIRDFFQKSRTPDSNATARVFSHFGDGAVSTEIFLVLYAYGEISHKNKFKRTGLLGAQSMLVTGIITGAVKLTLQRPLPCSGSSYDTWYDGKWNNIDDLAFPSGHTSSSFAFATIIASEFADVKYVPVLAYATASLTALAMMNDNLHWASDILPGAALGYFTAKKIEDLQKYDEAPNYTFLPIISREGVSFLCSFSF